MAHLLFPLVFGESDSLCWTWAKLCSHWVSEAGNSDLGIACEDLTGVSTIHTCGIQHYKRMELEEPLPGYKVDSWGQDRGLFANRGCGELLWPNKNVLMLTHVHRMLTLEAFPNNTHTYVHTYRQRGQSNITCKRLKVSFCLCVFSLKLLLFIGNKNEGWHCFDFFCLFPHNLFSSVFQEVSTVFLHS